MKIILSVLTLTLLNTYALAYEIQYIEQVPPEYVSIETDYIESNKDKDLDDKFITDVLNQVIPKLRLKCIPGTLDLPSVFVRYTLDRDTNSVKVSAKAICAFYEGIPL